MNYRYYAYLIFVILIPSCCSVLEKTEIVKPSGPRLVQQVVINGEIQELNISGAGLVRLSQGKEAALSIEADETVLPYVVTKNKNGTLSITIKDTVIIKNPADIIYNVTVQRISSMTLNGAVMLQSSEVINTDVLELAVSGTVQIDTYLQAQKLVVEATGAAVLNMHGMVGHQEIEAQGSVHYNASGLQCDVCRVDVSGSSRITVNAAKKLIGKATGAAMLFYHGNPQVNVSERGSASVSKLK